MTNEDFEKVWRLIDEHGIKFEKDESGKVFITQFAINERHADEDLVLTANIATSANWDTWKRRLALIARYWINRCLEAEKAKEESQ